MATGGPWNVICSTGRSNASYTSWLVCVRASWNSASDRNPLRRKRISNRRKELKENYSCYVRNIEGIRINLTGASNFNLPPDVDPLRSTLFIRLGGDDHHIMNEFALVENPTFVVPPPPLGAIGEVLLCFSRDNENSFDDDVRVTNLVISHSRRTEL